MKTKEIRELTTEEINKKKAWSEEVINSGIRNTYTFAAPISRLSRSPTPMRRTIVSAPGRRFVPSKKAEAISDSSDDEAVFTGRTSMIGGRSFNAAGRMSTTGRMSMAGTGTATQT